MGTYVAYLLANLHISLPIWRKTEKICAFCLVQWLELPARLVDLRLDSRLGCFLFHFRPTKSGQHTCMYTGWLWQNSGSIFCCSVAVIICLFFFSFLSFPLTQGQIGKVNAAFWSTQWNHTSHIRPQVHIKECYPLVFSCLTQLFNEIHVLISGLELIKTGSLIISTLAVLHNQPQMASNCFKHKKSWNSLKIFHSYPMRRVILTLKFRVLLWFVIQTPKQGCKKSGCVAKFALWISSLSSSVF